MHNTQVVGLNCEGDGMLCLGVAPVCLLRFLRNRPTHTLSLTVTQTHINTYTYKTPSEWMSTILRQIDVNLVKETR